MEIIDLHAHTTASDGTLTPTELVDLASRSGLKALAITDHDTIGGVSEGLARGREIGLEIVPGIEISVMNPGGTMHMLGYYLDHTDSELNTRLDRLQEARRERNPKIIAKLNKLGLDITMEEVVAESGGEQVGRPHFARVMVRKGQAASINEAFDRYLTKGGAAYEDKFRYSAEEAIGMITDAGGLPVLAHPFTLGLEDPRELEQVVADLAAKGLKGIEVYYSETPAKRRKAYLALAKKYNLKPTGGSDFHGNNKAAIKLGRGVGDLQVPYELLAGLREALEKKE